MGEGFAVPSGLKQAGDFEDIDEQSRHAPVLASEPGQTTFGQGGHEVPPEHVARSPGPDPPDVRHIRGLCPSHPPNSAAGGRNQLALRAEERCCLSTDHDLTRCGCRFNGRRTVHVRPHQYVVQDSIRLTHGGREKAAGVDACAHAKSVCLVAHGHPTEFSHSGLHFQAAGGRTRGVVLAGKEKQHGVAAEFHLHAVPPVGDFQHAVEVAVEHARHQFGALFAALGQALGHGGKAGDVAVHQRPGQPVTPERRLIGAAGPAVN